MSFAKQSGPPASAKQVKYLESLVEKAGFTGLREARHPLGLTQRQAGGKFSRGEASAMIDRLLADPTGGTAGGDGTGPPAVADGPSGIELSAREQLENEQTLLLRGISAGLIAGELERRGWTVTSPS